MTVHPDVSGRPGVLMMHERIIEHINKHDGVRWCTFDQTRRRLPEALAAREVASSGAADRRGPHARGLARNVRV